jgi:phage-related protein (TIGR01555 family)
MPASNLRVVPATIPAFEAAVSRNGGRLAVSRELVNRSAARSDAAQKLAYDAKLQQLLAPAQPYPGVVPPDRKVAAPKLAMDSTPIQVSGWAQQWAATSSLMEGQGFLGYTALAELAQRPEYRAIVETIAYEMTREGITLKTKGEGERGRADDRIGRMNELIKELKVLPTLAKAAAHDGFYGRGHIFIDTLDIDFDAPLSSGDAAELKSNVGDGRNEMSKAKVARGSLKRFVNVEPVWTYPTRYNSNNPLSPSWYKPSEWFVMGTELHSTRLMTLIGREVPDILKPAYSFGGLSMTQMAMPYVTNWLRTRQAVADLVVSFTTFVLGTNLSETMQVDGELLFNRAQLFNNLRNNQGLMLLDKDQEEFTNVSASIAGLHELQAQSQEHMSAVSRIPLVKLLGIQPAGLNASSEGEIRVFYDYIHAYQEFLFADPLRRMLDFIQLSEFGDVDPDIEADWNPLWQLDEAGKIAIQKTKTDIDNANFAMGVITAKTIAQRLAADPDSQYQGLDVEAALEEQELEQAQEEFEQEQQQAELLAQGGGQLDPETGQPMQQPGEMLEGKGEKPPEELGEQPPGRTPPPKDPANRLATGITNTAAKFGGAASGGFSAH